jgi:hypothetical protein
MLSASQWTSQGTILTCEGPSGIQGPQGNTGPTGASGPLGPSGTRGNIGTIGISGIGGVNPFGVLGTTVVGDFGPSGPTGPRGPTGPVGNTGATGVLGPSGALGPTGAVGLIGQMGPTGPVGPAGPTGPTGPDAANYIIQAQGTKFYGASGAQIVYTFSNLDKNILNHAGYYRLTAADLTTATGPIARSSTFTNYEFMILSTTNYQFSTGPTGPYFNNIVQTIPDINNITPYSVNIVPDALQIGVTPSPNNKINDNTTQYNARYNIVLKYTGTRAILLNWYLYKANLQLPVARNLTYYLCLFSQTLYGSLGYVPYRGVFPEPADPNRINQSFATNMTSSLPTAPLWRAGTFIIPNGTYTLSSLSSLLQSHANSVIGTTVNGKPFPPFNIFCDTDGLIAIQSAGQNGFFGVNTGSTYAGMAVGLFFGLSPNASAFLGCSNPAPDDPYGYGINSNRAILMLRGGIPDTTFTPTLENSKWKVMI